MTPQDGFEAWSVGGRLSFLYTESWALARTLMADYPQPTVYFRGSRPFGWQFLVNRNVVAILLRRTKPPLQPTPDYQMAEVRH